MTQMTRRTFLHAAPVAAAVTAATLSTGCASGTAGRRLRILSYNLHHGEGVDGRLDLGRIGELIRASGADVVALQEVDVNATRTGRVDQAAEYARLTGLQGQFGKAIDFQGGAYGQVLLSRWPLADFTVHRLPNPSRIEQRIAVSARISPPGMAPFRFVGLHLDASREDGDRWEQAGRLNELFGLDDQPTILAGDFNATPDSRVMGRLFERWTDAAAANPQPTIPAENPKARIDFVLYRPASGWRVKEATVLPEAVASDHRPLRVTFGG